MKTKAFILAAAAAGWSGISTGALAAPAAVIPSAFGTPTIDEVKSPGEWSAATPISVFGNLVGSQLYIMDDNVDLYLGLFVPDPTLTSGDQFWARIDSQNDDVTDAGDDEISVTGAGILYDGHFTEWGWGFLDWRRSSWNAGFRAWGTRGSRGKRGVLADRGAGGLEGAATGPGALLPAHVVDGRPIGLRKVTLLQ